MKRLLLCLALNLAVVSITAQIHFGIQGGFDFTTLNVKREIVNDVGIRVSPSYHFGIELGIELKENLRLITDLSFSRRAIKQEKSHSTSFINDFDVKYYYIELPVLAEFRTEFDKLNFHFAIGPYFAYGIRGTIDLTWYFDEFQTNYSEIVRWEDYDRQASGIEYATVHDYSYSQIRRFDYGAAIRIGIDRNRLSLNAECLYGLENLMLEYYKTENERINNRRIGISLTYYIINQ